MNLRSILAVVLAVAMVSCMWGTATADFYRVYQDDFDSYAADPQLEDNEGWSGADTDPGMSRLETVISAGPDRNVDLVAKQGTKDGIYSDVPFAALDQDDVFRFWINLEGVDFGGTNAGRLSVGLYDSTDGRIMGFAIRERWNDNRVAMYMEDWTVPVGSSTAAKVGAMELHLDAGIVPGSLEVIYERDGATPTMTLNAYTAADLGGSVLDTLYIADATVNDKAGDYAGRLDDLFTVDSLFFANSQTNTASTRVVGFTMDDFTVDAVPEPSTLVLTVFGLIGLAAFIRRRK